MAEAAIALNGLAEQVDGLVQLAGLIELFSLAIESFGFLLRMCAGGNTGQRMVIVLIGGEQVTDLLAAGSTAYAVDVLQFTGSIDAEHRPQVAWLVGWHIVGSH
ncbi:hypothetical protein D3C78_1575780 [compost metagenome]